MAAAGPVLCMGDVLLDVLVREGTVRGRESVTVEPGGSAANTAAWLAWCGVPVTLLAAVGDDMLGSLLSTGLHAGGVVLAAQVTPGAASGAFVARLDPTGYRPLATQRGANDLLTWGPADAALLHTARHLHLSGYTLAHPVSCAAAMAAAGAAHAAGLTVSLDLGAPHALHAAGSALPAALAAMTPEVLFANDEEAAALVRALDAVGGRAAPPAGPAAERLLDWAALVVVKEGARGSYALGRSWADQPVRHDPPAVAVVDDVGAGDAFVAGYLDAWLGGAMAAGERAAAAAALARGTAVAAVCLGRAGGRPPIA